MPSGNAGFVLICRARKGLKLKMVKIELDANQYCSTPNRRALHFSSQFFIKILRRRAACSHILSLVRDAVPLAVKFTH
jgi:hypothetical protein